MYISSAIFGIFIGTILICWVESARARDVINIFWNSSNPIFRIENTDHVFTARIDDVVNIHCPLYNDTVLEENTERTIVYMVSKFAYENCLVDSKAKPVGVCQSPYKPSKITVILREFTPSPNSLEFSPGESAYFISTSSGSEEGVFNKMGGLCLDKNMRMRFDIAPKAEELLTTPSPIDTIPDEYATRGFNPKWRPKMVPTVPKPNPKRGPTPAGAFIVPAAPTLGEPDLNEFFEKLNQESSSSRDLFNNGRLAAPLNEGPDWWSPNSAPESAEEEEDFQAILPPNNGRIPLYEIHGQGSSENEEQLVQIRNSQYWPRPMSDDGRAGRSGSSVPSQEQLVLYEIEEVDQRSLNSGNSISVRWRFLSCCLFLSLLFWRR